MKEVINAKKEATTEWGESGRHEDGELYAQANYTSKKEVATAKALSLSEA